MINARQISDKFYHWEYLVGVLLGVLWLGLALHGAWKKAPSIDEFSHIGDGVAILEYGDHRMNADHPPLVKVLSALPVMLFCDLDLSVERDGQELAPWVDGDKDAWGYFVVYFAGADPRLVVFLSRLVPVFIGLLGGMVAWLWGAELLGRRAGLLAYITLLFYPEYLGHSRFANFDIPVVVSAGILSYVAWQLWKRPSWKKAILLVVLSGILNLVKAPVIVFTVLLWVTVLGLLIARYTRKKPVIPTSAGEWFTLRKYLFITGMFLLSGYFFQWAGAGFQFKLQSGVCPMSNPHRLLDFEGYPDTPLANTIQFCHRHRLFPEASLTVVGHLLATGGRHMFLFRKLSFRGWYHYFLITILVKSPLNYLLISFGLFPFFLKRLYRGHGIEKEKLILLAVPFLILFLIILKSRLNIGHRHVLPLYFPWCVLLGCYLSLIYYKSRLGKIVCWFIPCAVVLLCLIHHPSQATFFNIIGGGSPKSGWHYLRDSNIDWGQDLILVAEKLDEVGYEKVNLAYFGNARPEAYGIDDYLFCLPGFNFAMYMPEASDPDPTRAFVVSLHVLDDVRALYPGRFDREPEYVCNSILIFAPEVKSRDEK